jgi:hypothetical protein
MDARDIDNALFERLAGVRQAAEGLNKAATEFAKICDGDSQSQTQSEHQLKAIKTPSEALKSLKKLVDAMQGDWNCWSEDRYKEVAMLCFEEMTKLRGPEAARAAASSN